MLGQAEQWCPNDCFLIAWPHFLLLPLPAASICCLPSAFKEWINPSPIMLRSPCRVLAATNSGPHLGISSSFVSLAWHASVIVWYWSCSINYAGDKCLLIGYVVLSVASCSWTCLGSETVSILTSTFWFLISHAGLWYMTGHCFQGMLKLLTRFFVKVYLPCIAKLSRKKACPCSWVSITKDASYIVGILPFWWFLHSMSLCSCVAVVFFASQMTYLLN